MPEPPRQPGEGASRQPDLSAITIRPVRESDRPFLRRLADHLWPGESASTHRRTAFAELDHELISDAAITRPARYWFIATDAHALPLGILSLRFEDEEAPSPTRVVVAVMAVAGGIDDQSVGSAMLAFAEDWSSEQGAEEVALEHFANPRVGSFYESLGYVADVIRRVKRLDRDAR